VEFEGIFLNALYQELQQQCVGMVPTTIYIGGGTPSALSGKTLDSLLARIHVMSLSKLIEFTVEVNPGDLNDNCASILKNNGVNRVSIGVQSLNDQTLRILGRRHNSDTALRSIEVARKAGISNISIDLIADVPKTTESEWESEVRQVASLGIQHISVYSLTIEENTPFACARDNGDLMPVSQEESADRMRIASSILASQDYTRYEISNYCKPGFECRHNSVYWSNRQYIGLGPAAVSFKNRIRRRNIRDLQLWAQAIASEKDPCEMSEQLTDMDFAGETAMLMLRRVKGIDRGEFVERTGIDPFTLYQSLLERLQTNGRIVADMEHIRIPEEFLPVADSIICEFLRPGL
jgi:oxygen-independent coproporphyrinogen III oxidase